MISSLEQQLEVFEKYNQLIAPRRLSWFYQSPRAAFWQECSLEEVWRKPVLAFLGSVGSPYDGYFIKIAKVDLENAPVIIQHLSDDICIKYVSHGSLEGLLIATRYLLEATKKEDQVRIPMLIESCPSPSTKENVRMPNLSYPRAPLHIMEKIYDRLVKFFLRNKNPTVNVHEAGMTIHRDMDVDPTCDWDYYEGVLYIFENNPQVFQCCANNEYCLTTHMEKGEQASLPPPTEVEPPPVVSTLYFSEPAWAIEEDRAWEEA